MQPRRSEQEWRDIVARFERSGKTREEFCGAEGLVISTLDAWRRKLRATAPVPARFVEFAIPDGSAPATVADPAGELVVELPFGVTLRFRGLSR